MKTEKEIFGLLDEAMHKRKQVVVSTKERGFIVGTLHGVDEFDTDPDRLGYFIVTAPHMMDTVFLDEIVSVEEYDRESDYITA